jgi:predicted small lipoprotein YifL
MKRLAAMVFVVFALAACGNKGPLVMPEAKPAAAPVPAEQPAAQPTTPESGTPAG